MKVFTGKRTHTLVCSTSRIHIKKYIFACENFPLSPSPPSKSNGPHLQIKDEAARRPKTSHFAILDWGEGGGGGLGFPFTLSKILGMKK